MLFQSALLALALVAVGYVAIRYVWTYFVYVTVRTAMITWIVTTQFISKKKENEDDRRA